MRNFIHKINRALVAKKHKLQKFLSLLLVLCAAVTISADNIAQGSFKNGGTWRINDQGELYVDAVAFIMNGHHY